MRAASALALYMRRPAANSIICHGKRPVPKYFSCDLRGDSLQVSHSPRSYSLSLIGGEAVLVLSPSPSSSPKIVLPQVSQEPSQSALQQVKDFPGPSLVPSQNAPTPDDHSVYRQRCWAASKKNGSSADSKIKSSQSMKSALITLHT